MTAALGGPNNYKGKDMREGHKHLNLKESDFDTIVKHLGATLTEIGCPGELIGKIAGALVALKDEVLNK
ncbi:MAG: group 1 truncated hemoglobin [SAR202 cluster bacterium]|nr:group 1 truncated hemoglobin [SAR202 cluster bacterium]